MRRSVWLALLGGSVYLAALAVQVPAAWVVHWGQDALPEKVSLSGVQGSLWHPTVDRFTVDLPQAGRLEGGPAEVQVGLWPLLRGRLRADMEALALGGEATGRAEVGLNGGWRVPRVEASLPLRNLAKVDSRLDFGQGGTLTVTGEGLQGTELPRKGSLRATVREFRLPGLGPEGPYGTYRAEAEIDDAGRIQGRVVTASADLLGIEGQLQGNLNAGTARFTGEAWVPDGAPEEARQLLGLFGKVREGRAQIRWQGGLR